jgi:hypothetical protein
VPGSAALHVLVLLVFALVSCSAALMLARRRLLT